MAKLTFQSNGIDTYIKFLDTIGKGSTGMIKRAVYDGAAVIGQSIANGINSLPTAKDQFIPSDLPITGITEAQKRGLLEGGGFAKMQNDNGYINTKWGFDGYNSVKTKKYPNGQPNALIANAVNSGTSRRPKTNFINKAVKSSKAAAEAAMSARFDEDMSELTKE